jgi:hypothetical protein
VRAAAVVAACLAATVAAPATAEGARALPLEGWLGINADFSGRSLVWTEAATVRLDPATSPGRLPARLSPFVYYRVHGSSAALDGARRRFRGAVEQPVAVRTQVARMSAGQVVGDGRGGFVMVPGARRFAAPVIWCCEDGVETVIHSDGRADAPVPLAAGPDGAVVRSLVRHADGTVGLTTADPAEVLPRPSEVPFPGRPAPNLAAIATGIVAWVDDDAPQTLRVGRPTDAGVVKERRVGLAGSALRVWADRGLVVVAVRQGSGVGLVRIDGLAGPVRAIWRGRGVPPVGLGGGTVAAAAGRTVLAARSGRLRVVARARGTVAAVAAARGRVAWFERVRRPDGRRTVVRIGRIS